jgi:hypothetical protein
MTCTQCHKEIIHDGILVSPDGDFVCSKKCEKQRQKEMDEICAMTHKRFIKWMEE